MSREIFPPRAEAGPNFALHPAPRRVFADACSGSAESAARRVGEQVAVPIGSSPDFLPSPLRASSLTDNGSLRQLLVSFFLSALCVFRTGSVCQGRAVRCGITNREHRRPFGTTSTKRDRRYVDSRRFLKRHQAKRLRGTCVNHGSISDSRPIAFFGCPRGHRVNNETSTGDAYLRGGYSPSNPRVRESTGQQQGRDPGVSIGSPHTLKRIAVSIVLDRSLLLSSKPSIQSPLSCAPRSAVPSQASFLWTANSHRNRSTDPCTHWPGWPRS
jgi:hypothetical protein